jgi:hypothetical protein
MTIDYDNVSTAQASQHQQAHSRRDEDDCVRVIQPKHELSAVLTRAPHRDLIVSIQFHGKLRASEPEQYTMVHTVDKHHQARLPCHP